MESVFNKNENWLHCVRGSDLKGMQFDGRPSIGNNVSGPIEDHPVFVKINTLFPACSLTTSLCFGTPDKSSAEILRARRGDNDPLGIRVNFIGAGRKAALPSYPPCFLMTNMFYIDS
jgi:hypothetical protein